VYLGQIWLDSWGKKTDILDERKEIFNKWFDKAPKLNPINSHLFIISEPNNTDNIIISIRGHDTIILGGNLRHYLINELSSHLNLNKLVYDKEDNEWYPEATEPLIKIHDSEYKKLIDKDIPYWKEFLISNGYNNFLKE
jgi:hypothetical protein